MSSSGIMEGKVAVVTGAGRAIGKAIAVLMAAEGARVVVNDLGVDLDGTGPKSEPADQVVAEIREAGGEAVASFDDVSGWNSAHRIIECALDSFGRVDCVVNNAGILRDTIFHKMTEEDFDACINVMLKGSFNVSRAAAPHFRKQTSGAFVHMTSTSGLIGAMGQVNYASAKLGMVALSKCIAVDMKAFNVRSNAVAPTAWSRMTASIPANDPENAKRVKQRQAVTPEKNAPLVVYLCSDAAKDVTGQVFSVRMNEIHLMTQSRPLRSIHRGEGWTPQTIAEHAMPALRQHFYALDRTKDVFSWDSV